MILMRQYISSVYAKLKFSQQDQVPKAFLFFLSKSIFFFLPILKLTKMKPQHLTSKRISPSFLNNFLFRQYNHHHHYIIPLLVAGSKFFLSFQTLNPALFFNQHYYQPFVQLKKIIFRKNRHCYYNHSTNGKTFHQNGCSIFFFFI